MNCVEKIVRADNLLQFIRKVTFMEFKFWKSLTQERFKSNFEFRYQIILSSIKFTIYTVQAPLCLHSSNYHIVGNQMPWLNNVNNEARKSSELCINKFIT